MCTSQELQVITKFVVDSVLALLADMSDVVAANRLSDEIKDIADKVYTRDIFSRDCLILCALMRTERSSICLR